MIKGNKTHTDECVLLEKILPVPRMVVGTGKYLLYQTEKVLQMKKPH